MNPNLQRVWDSTSLRDFLACPQRYKYAKIDGWQTPGQKIDVDFGRIAGDGLETFYRGIIEDGLTHDEATRRAVRRVLELSWDNTNGTPLLGSYEQVWRCTGVTKYRNPKGNAAKCPFSHKGKFWAAPGPEICGACGSPTETSDKWLPENPAKDRYQLVRLIVWYSEEVKGGYLKPIRYQHADGTHQALVEVPWTLPLNEEFSLCGWFDAVKVIGGLANEAYVTDYKTTKHTLGPGFFAPFAPDIQVSIYDLAGSMLFRDNLPYSGVAIEGIQTLLDGVRFDFRPFRKTPEQRAEFVKELGWWLATAREYAQEGYWPMNRASCHLCPFKEVCASPEKDRPRLLAERFEKSFWNPLTRQRETTRG